MAARVGRQVQKAVKENSTLLEAVPQTGFICCQIAQRGDNYCFIVVTKRALIDTPTPFSVSLSFLSLLDLARLVFGVKKKVIKAMIII